MFGTSLQNKLKKFDVYQKIPSQYCQSTLFGALISVVSVGIMIFLFITEWNYNSQLTVQTDMSISENQINQKTAVNFDIILHAFPCDLVSVDVMDVMGNHQVHTGQDIKRKRLDQSGQYLEDFRMQDEKDSHVLQDHSQEVDFSRLKKAIETQEGCQLAGSIEINKVPGNFHISAHGFHDALHYVANEFKRNIIQYNLAHTINHLSFGNLSDILTIKKKFTKTASISPIDGSKSHSELFMTYEYYLKVTSTQYEDIAGKKYSVHQFDANENSYLLYQRIPAIWFKYDLTPISVKFTQTRKRFLEFLVSICAILGGIYTIAGIIDGVVNKSLAIIVKKAQMGKLA